MDKDTEELILELYTSILDLEDRLAEQEQKVKEYEGITSALTSVDRLTKSNCPKVHAIIAGLIAFNRRRDGLNKPRLNTRDDEQD